MEKFEKEKEKDPYEMGYVPHTELGADSIKIQPQPQAGVLPGEMRFVAQPKYSLATTIRAENNKGDHAYVRLLDPDFIKDKVTIDIPFLDDPTGNGHFRRYLDELASFKEKKIKIDRLYCWCPQLSAQLDLFTLHVFESTENPNLFTDLKIIPLRPDPYQVRGDVICIEALGSDSFWLTEKTRIGFIVPAFAKMTLDLWTEDASDEMPL
jgi:hypothetical protein